MVFSFGIREECDYTKCYCEENIYKLCERIPEQERSTFFVVFISNPNKCFPLFQQKASGDKPFVMWDYHVILLQRLEGADILVWDLDTVLPFPCNFEKYFKESIDPAQWNIPSEYSRYFRIIPCQEYLRHFSSDRSHMLAEDGTWMSPPPAWDPILKNGLNNIEDFISMDQDVLKDISVVVGENEMYSQCAKLCSVE